MTLFWLQPSQPENSLRFWFPFMTLFLVMLAWLLTSTKNQRSIKNNFLTIIVMTVIPLSLTLTRYLKFENIYLTEIPRIQVVLTVTLVGFALVVLLIYLQRSISSVLLLLMLIGLITIFMIIKSPELLSISANLLSKGEVPPVEAISWLGYSYVAFRLIHTIRDRQMGRLPDVSLGEYANYVLFFPAIVAGPIDRLERFVIDLNEGRDIVWIDAGTRLATGLIKKFVVADSLAFISLNPILAESVITTGGAWVLVYAYAFRIYFDFSGYTDIAIGIAQLTGIHLPENFLSPYLKPNLTQFWNSWHITLTQWFRAYFFNPLTRALRTGRLGKATGLIVVISQLTTMILIGLWHGISWNFILWGLWHGLGLVAHNRWASWLRGRRLLWSENESIQWVSGWLGTALTFHYVALGWVFFALPSSGLSMSIFEKLFGVVG